VEFSSCGRVCITGGEPLLQRDEAGALVKRLDKAGYLVEIETNGTIDFSPLQAHAFICMDMKCPSSGEVSDLSLLSQITGRDAVKFVVDGTEDLDYARDVIASHPIQGEYLISPVFGSDYGALAREVLDRNMPVRFQIQIHRILGVR
jgi:7-carboxy-7-deazaguanine synthase